MMLTPASTDAVNRASRVSYGEATGITQTARNYAASPGLAVLGTLPVTEFRNHLRQSLSARGVPAPQAAGQARTMTQANSTAQGGGGSIPSFARLDFAEAIRTVPYCMSAVMATAAVVAFLGQRRHDHPGSAQSKLSRHRPVRR
jgi:hypothetical protein